MLTPGAVTMMSVQTQDIMPPPWHTVGHTPTVRTLWGPSSVCALQGTPVTLPILGVLI